MNNSTNRYFPMIKPKNFFIEPNLETFFDLQGTHELY